MRVEMQTPRIFLLTMLGAFALSGCSSVDAVMGSSKDAPDEFAIVTKQPLIVPPEFNLHPPKPGAAPVNQLSPTDAAQSALFSDDPNQVAGAIPGNYSPVEKMLLANAGAAGATDSIRQLIAADNKKLEAADDDFTNRILFGGGSDDSDHPLDADAEAARLDSGKPQTRPAAEAPDDQTVAPPDDSGGAMPDLSGSAAPASAAQPSTASATPDDTSDDQSQMAGTLPDVNSKPSAHPAPRQHRAPAKKKDDSGWFDGIF